MTEFERGVRFVLESTETYTRGHGSEVLQFGDYVMSMVHKPASDLLKGSAEHRERRVKAIVALGEAPPPSSRETEIG